MARKKETSAQRQIRSLKAKLARFQKSDKILKMETKIEKLFSKIEVARSTSLETDELISNIDGSTNFNFLRGYKGVLTKIRKITDNNLKMEKLARLQANIKLRAKEFLGVTRRRLYVNSIANSLISKIGSHRFDEIVGYIGDRDGEEKVQDFATGVVNQVFSNTNLSNSEKQEIFAEVQIALQDNGFEKIDLVGQIEVLGDLYLL